MKGKVKFNFTVCVLTAFLVFAVYFFAFPTCSAAQDGSVKIVFVYQNSRFVYDSGLVKYDSRSYDTVSALQRRGFFASNDEKLKIMEQVQSLGFSVGQAAEYVLTGIGKVVDEIDKKVSYDKIDSQIKFNPDGQEIFKISEGKDGRRLDKDKLYAEVKRNLRQSGSFTVSVPTQSVKAISKSQNEAKTQLKAKFTTSYKSSTEDRKSNVKRALSKFNGMIVQPDQMVSFNDTVGERTVKNGYKKAKIIVNGKYTDGVGGGVCQASTTLYNAVLLAGLKIDEWHRHTLKSSYVKPSFDAMVNSNGADLVFTNDSGSPLYIRTVCDGENASVYVYGLPTGFQIERKYRVVAENPAKIKTITDTQGKYADKIPYDDQQLYLQRPVDGLSTEGYIVIKKDGKVVEQRLIRRDTYKSVDGIVVKGAQKRPVEPTPPDEEAIPFEGIA